MNSCSICLDVISEDTKIITKCNHIFHKKCILQWLEENENCPLCRKETFIQILTYFRRPTIFYKYMKYKRLSKTINGNFVGDLEIKLKRDFFFPRGFFNIKPRVIFSDIKTCTNNEFKIPVFRLPYLDSCIDIDFYTRLVALYNKNTNITLLDKNTFNNFTYFESKEECEYLSKRKFVILFQWTFDLLECLNLLKIYNYFYSISDYTIIYDVLIETIIHFKINIEKKSTILQGLTICSVLNVLNFKKTPICFQDLNYYTVDTYRKKDLIKYIQFGKKYLQKNLIKILSV